MFSKILSATILRATLTLSLPCSAELHRGVWFWGSTTLPDASPSPYGSIAVVGDGVAIDTLAGVNVDGVLAGAADMDAVCRNATFVRCLVR